MPAKKPPPPKSRQKNAAAPLERYRQKRDFKRTPEPAARQHPRRAGLTFVVQDHHARTHHYDFRLEMDGVLASWAVPKGIPEDPAAKRLAVHVEDHPLEYGGFEGTIPQGNYGAGTVAIWDKGRWQPLDKDWRGAFAAGKLKFVLEGGRLHGVYLLARMGDEPNWLLRKLKDDAPVAAGQPPDREQARFVSPQLARIVPTVPCGGEWLHELKYDGYRLVVVKTGEDIHLFTRNGLDWTHRFRALAKELLGCSAADFVLDGEAVVFDDHGRPRFGDLQQALQTGDEHRIHFVAFDILHLDGANLRSLPLAKRLEYLQAVVSDAPGPIRRSKVWPGELGRELFTQACRNGLEGIVSKKAAGRYLEGTRRDWVKSKCHARQEFVVCGYTAPKGTLRGFGALVLASRENGRWIPRGKVGTGFSDQDRLAWLDLMRPLQVPRGPFPSKERHVTWLEPRLVVEVEFSEITREGSIRQGSFVARREDKAPEDVHLDPTQTAAADPNKTRVAGVLISHPDRLVYPADQITKLDVARYYEQVAEWMLPFVAKRPLALLRAPDGVAGDVFFQKSFANHLPADVRQTQLADGATVISIGNTKGLVSLVQFGVIELHPWGASLAAPEKPDTVIWDLDPDPAVPWNEVLGAAVLLRDYLDAHGLTTVVRTSGGKGLHIQLFLKRRHGWDVIRDFAKAVAAAIAGRNPQRFLISSTKSRRRGKIFIDWMRNSRGATCIAPWCLRARDGAAVAMPVAWDNLREITSNGFTLRQPPQRPPEWSQPQAHHLKSSFLRELGLRVD